MSLLNCVIMYSVVVFQFSEIARGDVLFSESCYYLIKRLVFQSKLVQTWDIVLLLLVDCANLLKSFSTNILCLKVKSVIVVCSKYINLKFLNDDINVDESIPICKDINIFDLSILCNIQDLGRVRTIYCCFWYIVKCRICINEIKTSNCSKMFFIVANRFNCFTDIFFLCHEVYCLISNHFSS